MSHLHVAPQDDGPVKGRVSRGRPPAVHGAGETEEKAPEVQILLSTPLLHQLHPSTLHTEVQLHVKMAGGEVVLELVDIVASVEADLKLVSGSVPGSHPCYCSEGVGPLHSLIVSNMLVA